MKKKLIYIIFLLAMLLTFNFSVNALDCFYEGKSNDKVTYASFRIDDQESKIVRSIVYGYIDTTDPSHQGDIAQNEKIVNWNEKYVTEDYNKKVVDIDFVGKDYYDTNKKCPNSLLLLDRKNGFTLLAMNPSSFQDLYMNHQDYLNESQGYAIMNLVEDSSDKITLYPDYCLSLGSNSCENNLNFACVWVEDENAAGDKGGYCNVDNLQYVGCGSANDIPMQVPSLISLLVNLLKIATPIILIFVSIITLLKALASQKEDEIKKAQSSLIKKIIAAAMVFFVITIVQFVVSKVATDDEYTGFTDCLDCFLNNKCTQATYYRTVINGEDYCTPLTTGQTDTCKNLFK